MKLKDKVALITGAGRGIGRAIALHFAREGADVMLAARTRNEIEAVAKSVNACGRRSLAIVADVSKEEDVDSMVNAAIREFGRIDILVNSAGIGGPAGPVVCTSVAEWDATISVNLRGVFLVARAVLPAMIEAKSGKVINVASSAGLVGVPNISAYCASKFGVIGLTQSLAREVAEVGICVNSLCPGPTETSLAQTHWPLIAEAARISIQELRENIVRNTPQKRILSVDDVTPVAVFLASRDSDGITGEEIVVAGGYKGI